MFSKAMNPYRKGETVEASLAWCGKLVSVCGREARGVTGHPSAPALH